MKEVGGPYKGKGKTAQEVAMGIAGSMAGGAAVGAAAKAGVKTVEKRKAARETAMGIAGSMAGGRAVGAAVKAAAKEAGKGTKGKGKGAKKTIQRSLGESVKKAAEAKIKGDIKRAEKLIQKGMGAIPVLNIAAETAKEFKEKLETMLRSMGEGLKTAAVAKTKWEIDQAEALKERGRRFNAFMLEMAKTKTQAEIDWAKELEEKGKRSSQYMLEMAVLMREADERELKIQGEMALGMGKEARDQAIFAGKVAVDMGTYLIGLNAEYPEEVKQYWKEVGQGVGYMATHPKETMKAMGEAFANATPEDMGRVLFNALMFEAGIAAGAGGGAKSGAEAVKAGAKAAKAEAKFGAEAVKEVKKLSPELKAVVKETDEVVDAAKETEKIVKRGSDSLFTNGMSPEDAKRYNQWVALREAGLDQEKINDIILTNKGLRPDPSAYLSKNYIDNHLSLFDKGGTIIMTEQQYEKFVLGSDFIGIPNDGTQFVLPKSMCDDIAATAKGDISYYEKALGFDNGHFSGGGGLVRIDIGDLDELNLRMPSGNEYGANNHWVPGGLTDGGVPEAITDLIPNNITNVRITELGN